VKTHSHTHKVFLFNILVKLNVAGVLDKLTAVVSPVDRIGDRRRIILIVRAHHTLDVFCGLDGVVEGHLGEQMVTHVGV